MKVLIVLALVAALLLTEFVAAGEAPLPPTAEQQQSLTHKR
jgi:hypothetical protein